MSLKEDLIAYQARWAALENQQNKERQTASLELRWRQLNAAYALAKGLGLIQTDSSETGVFERWAKLKEKTVSKPSKT